jgi:hypothetical protein
VFNEIISSSLQDNSDVLNKNNFLSEAQISSLMQQAQHISNLNAWMPTMAMIDKSFAERNALEQGMNIPHWTNGQIYWWFLV